MLSISDDILSTTVEYRQSYQFIHDWVVCSIHQCALKNLSARVVSLTDPCQLVGKSTANRGAKIHIHIYIIRHVTIYKTLDYFVHLGRRANITELYTTLHAFMVSLCQNKKMLNDLLIQILSISGNKKVGKVLFFPTLQMNFFFSLIKHEI